MHFVKKEVSSITRNYKEQGEAVALLTHAGKSHGRRLVEARSWGFLGSDMTGDTTFTSPFMHWKERNDSPLTVFLPGEDPKDGRAWWLPNLTGLWSRLRLMTWRHKSRGENGEFTCVCETRDFPELGDEKEFWR